RGQRRPSGGRDEHARPRGCDERVGALQQDDAAVPIRRTANGLEAMSIHPIRRLSEQTPQLAGMRGEHTRSRPLPGLELEEGVCVDHRGELYLREQSAYERTLLV